MTGNPDASLTIDTHHHILPDFFWQATENAHAPVGGLAPLRWSKEATISFMDDAGIDIAVVSLSTPGVHTGDSAKARPLARRCNEFSAELVHARPDRFGGFACLPLPADLVNLRVGAVTAPTEGSLEEPLVVLAELKRQGLIRHLGVSNVIPEQLGEAQKITDIACVQNFYNVTNRNDDAFVDRLAKEGIAYATFFPLGGFTP